MLPFECVYCLYYYSLSTSNLAHEYASKKQLFTVCVCVPITAPWWTDKPFRPMDPLSTTICLLTCQHVSTS